MNAIATKFQVTAAALAVGATAAFFAPIAANAAPAVQVPTAPVHQMVGDLAEAPGDFLFYTQVISLQIIASNIRWRSSSLEGRAQSLQVYAANNPGTFFGQLAAARAQTLLERRAALGALTFSACKGDKGIQVGPYGTVDGGPPC